MKSNSVTIIYDNRSSQDNLRPGWGFSALVEHDGVRLLFDTGGDKIVLEQNARALGIDIKDTDYLFFSHEHCDHVGAASSALHKGLTVVYPASFSKGFKKKVEAAGATSLYVTSSIEFSPGLLSTGELGTTLKEHSLKEHSLIVTTTNGPVLITGCAHPGIVEIARVATDIAGGPLRLVLGGFHLGATPPDKVRKIGAALHDLGVQQVGPCHCTGQRAISILKGMFGADGLDVMAGTQIAL